MTVFKTFLRILQKNLGPALVGTIATVVVCVFNFTSGNKAMDFADTKPKVTIQNLDQSAISENLIAYFNNNAEVVAWPESEDQLADAIFNDDIDYAITIPENFGSDIMGGITPEVEVKNPGDYGGYLSETLLSRYLTAATSQHFTSESELIAYLDSFFEENIEVEISSAVDINAFEKMASYFNFLNYSIIYTVVFVIGTMSVIFSRETLVKRMAISPTSLQKIKQQVLKYDFLIAATIWAIYIIMGYILIGDTMLTTNGLLMILNSFVFTIFSTVLGFLLTNFIHNDNAVNIVNQIISLGTSFLCGVFLPLKYLPDFVVKFAHILPSFYYVEINNKLAEISDFNFETLKSVLTYTVFFVSAITIMLIANRIITRKNLKK